MKTLENNIFDFGRLHSKKIRRELSLTRSLNKIDTTIARKAETPLSAKITDCTHSLLLRELASTAVYPIVDTFLKSENGSCVIIDKKYVIDTECFYFVLANQHMLDAMAWLVLLLDDGSMLPILLLNNSKCFNNGDIALCAFLGDSSLINFTPENKRAVLNSEKYFLAGCPHSSEIDIDNGFLARMESAQVHQIIKKLYNLDTSIVSFDMFDIEEMSPHERDCLFGNTTKFSAQDALPSML